MNRFLSLNFLLLLAAAIAHGNPKMACTSHSYTEGRVDGSLILEVINPELEYNGVVKFYGSKINDYFQEELRTLRANCYFSGGHGVAVRICSVPARVRLDRTGNYSVVTEVGNGVGFTGISDYGGLKILVTQSGADTGKNWWFSSCYFHRD